MLERGINGAAGGLSICPDVDIENRRDDEQYVQIRTVWRKSLIQLKFA